MSDPDKIELQHLDDNKAPVQHTQLKSGHDELGLFRTALNFKKAIFVCTALCIAAAADGYQINLNGNIIANSGFIRAVGYQSASGKWALHSNDTALWGAMQSLGQMIGMLGLNPISDRIGRKYTLYALWLILAASVAIESTVKNAGQWAGAKVLAGMGVGAIQSTLPIYITEWSPNNIRGAMATAYSIWNNLGNFLAPMILYILGLSKPYEFKIPIYTQWAFLGLMLPIFLWLPETASYYAARDQDERGRATLRRVNGKVKGYDVEKEYAIVKNIILEERAAREELNLDADSFGALVKSYAACFKGVNWKRTIGGAIPLTLQQLTGLAFLNVYASLFFKESGFSNAFLITTILTALKVVSILVIAATSDRFGRRPMVCYAGVWCTLMLLIVGILGQVKRTTAAKNALIVIACFWSMGNTVLGALGWAFVGEVPAQKLRARTAGISSAISVIFGLTFNTAVPVMLDSARANWGYNTAWFFFALGLIGTALAFYFVPETAQRNPAELDELFEAGVPAWKMKTYVTNVQREQGGVVP